MKTYALADLHGRYDLLQEAFAQIAVHAWPDRYKVVTLGDYVDRGPQSREIIARLMGGPDGDYELVCLKGNHEDMMVETLTAPLHPNWWVGNGGGQTLISYGHERAGDYHPEVVPADHIEWLRSLPTIHIDRHRVFVHAGVDPTIPLDEQTERAKLWMLYPDGADLGHGERHVVHGHHQFADGPVLLNHRTDLDTFAWATGRLAIGVFDDDVAGGPVEIIEAICPAHPSYQATPIPPTAA